MTELLRASSLGDREAESEVYDIVYAELRRLAASQLGKRGAGDTLQPTELVSEVYLRLTGSQVTWETRKHYLSAAARAMRHVLIDRARRRRSEKRGGDLKRVTLSGLESPGGQEHFDIVAVDDALSALEAEQPRLAKLIELRVFTGLSVEECAETLGVSTATVKRDWAFAKTWLVERLNSSGS